MCKNKILFKFCLVHTIISSHMQGSRKHCDSAEDTWTEGNFGRVFVNEIDYFVWGIKQC